MFWHDAQPLILASRSAPRRAMLEAAGIPVEVDVPDIDERAVEAAAGALEAIAVAARLAREKARIVTARRPGRLVVAADQTLALGTTRFDKPHDRAAAARQIAALSGRTHHLHSAVAVARDGGIVFEAVDTASLTMRELLPTSIEAYLEAAGAEVTASVGAYQLEKLGVHLFERIDGNFFTILGLPLLPLLGFLRQEGCLP